MDIRLLLNSNTKEQQEGKLCLFSQNNFAKKETIEGEGKVEVYKTQCPQCKKMISYGNRFLQLFLKTLFHLFSDFS